MEQNIDIINETRIKNAIKTNKNEMNSFRMVQYKNTRFYDQSVAYIRRFYQKKFFLKAGTNYT